MIIWRTFKTEATFKNKINSLPKSDGDTKGTCYYNLFMCLVLLNEHISTI